MLFIVWTTKLAHWFIAAAPGASYASVGFAVPDPCSCGLSFHGRRIEAAEEHLMMLIPVPILSVIVAPTRV
jgi:hypothetical protein